MNAHNSKKPLTEPLKHEKYTSSLKMDEYKFMNTYFTKACEWNAPPS